MGSWRTIRAGGVVMTLLWGGLGVGCGAGPSALVQDLPDGSDAGRLGLGEPIEVGLMSVRLPLDWRPVRGRKARWREPNGGRAEMAVEITEGKPDGMTYGRFWAKMSERQQGRSGATVEEEGEVGLGSLAAYGMTLRQQAEDFDRGVRVYMVVGVRETYVLTFEAPWEAWSTYEPLFRRSAESISVLAHELTFRRNVRVGDGILVIPEGWSRVAGQDGLWSGEGGEATMEVAIDSPRLAEQTEEAFWQAFSTRFRQGLQEGETILDEGVLKIARQPAYMLQLRRGEGTHAQGVTVVVVSTEANLYVMTFAAPWARYEQLHPAFMQSAASFELITP